MLRDIVGHDNLKEIQARSQTLLRGTDALLEAKAQFELLLARNDVWCELKHIVSRGDDDVSDPSHEIRAQRDRLTRELASEPAFVAWQFVEAALACLALSTMTLEEETGAESRAAASPDAATRQPEGLVSRIPTLEPTEIHDRPGPGSDLPYDEDSTRFTSAAVGIEEAQVKIVVRQPEKPLIEFKLPPLPFAPKTATGDAERRAIPANASGGHPSVRVAEAEIAIVPARPKAR